MIQQNNHSIFIRRLLYQLKRDFGLRAAIYQAVESVDGETGVRSINKTKFRIRKAIILPDDVQRKFAYDISYLAANKNFVYGATWDQDLRAIIIDRAELPNSFELDLNSVFVYNHQRYEIKKANNFEPNLALFVWVRGVKGDVGQEILENRAYNRLILQQTLSYTRGP